MPFKIMNGIYFHLKNVDNWKTDLLTYLIK